MNSTKEKTTMHSPAFTFKNKLERILWAITYYTLFRYSPTPFFEYRNFVLRLFGSSIGHEVRIYPSVRIWHPANLTVNHGATLGPRVSVYNQGQISIGISSILSQDSHVCASTHNYNDPIHPLILDPVIIEDNVWICAESFIGPGVTVSEGSVLGARGVLMKNSDAWCVYAGNPAIKVNYREKFE